MVKTFNEFIKESIWGDLQRRGMGIQVKKEDIVRMKSEYENIMNSAINYFAQNIVYENRYDNTLETFKNFLKHQAKYAGLEHMNEIIECRDFLC